MPEPTTIKFFEEIHAEPQGGGELRTVILYKPNKNSSEVNLYEKRQRFTNFEQMIAENEAFKAMKTSSAMSVFYEFYTKDLLN